MSWIPFLERMYLLLWTISYPQFFLPPSSHPRRFASLRCHLFHPSTSLCLVLAISRIWLTLLSQSTEIRTDETNMLSQQSRCHLRMWSVTLFKIGCPGKTAKIQRLLTCGISHCASRCLFRKFPRCNPRSTSLQQEIQSQCYFRN